MLVEGTGGENLDPLIRVSMDDVQFFLRIFMRGTAQYWSLGHGMNFAGEKRPYGRSVFIDEKESHVGSPSFAWSSSRSTCGLSSVTRRNNGQISSYTKH